METRAYSILLAAVVLAGCSPCRHCPRNFSQKDSVYIDRVEVVTQIDTVIQWRIPDGGAEATLPDSDTSRLSTSLARSEAWVKDGQLHHTLTNRSELAIPISITVPQRAVTTDRFRLRDRVVTVEVEKELSWWQKFWISAGKILPLVALLLILILYLSHKKRVF